MHSKLFFAAIIPLGLALLAVAFMLRANVWAGPSAPSGVPGQISYQGYLTDDGGQPISGTADLEFGLYDAPSGC